MDQATVTIEGVNQVLRSLDRFDKKVRRKIERKAVRAAGKPVLASAKRMVPIADEYDVHDVDHQAGMLQKSLRLRALKSSRSRRRAGIYGVRIQSGAESHMFQGETFYGGFVEFGTVNQAAQGFMAAASQENQSRSRQIFVSEIKRYVAEEGKRGG
jgi:HK97 gp10 family phage protein